MEGKKQKSDIDAVALMIYKAPEMWKNQYVVGKLLINIKRAFDYVFQARLAKKIANLEIINNLIVWTKSFLINRCMWRIYKPKIKSWNKNITGIACISNPVFNRY